MPAEWIDCGKTYDWLRHELAQAGESIVGLQVHLKEIVNPKMTERTGFVGIGLTEGEYLVGDIDSAGDVSGEEYVTIGHCTVVRYRRLVAAELLK